MANSTIWDLAAESVMLATHRIPVQDTATTTAAQHATFSLLGGMEITTGSDADTIMAVGTLYRVDMSAWATAVRTYRLPSTAKVGERVGIYITAGNPAHELAIRTVALSNDTINGVDRDSSDWSKLFITGETVVFECVVADTDWVVLHDGRIPCTTKMFAATAGTTNTAGVLTQMDLDGTPAFDVGDISNEGATFGEVLVRRDGRFYIHMAGRPKNLILIAEYYRVAIEISGTAKEYTFVNSSKNSEFMRTQVTGVQDLVDGDTIEMWFASTRADRGYTANKNTNYMIVREMLVP